MFFLSQILKWYLRKKFRYSNKTDGLSTIEYKLLRIKKTKFYSRLVVNFEKDEFLKYDNVDSRYLNKNYTRLDRPWELV